MKDIKEMLLTAPPTAIDPVILPMIQDWDEPTASSLQILKVIDICVNECLADSRVVSILQVLYETVLRIEGKKHEDNVPFATWRLI